MPRGNPAWKKGQSANPKGRPKGTRNRCTLVAIEKMEKAGVDPLNVLMDLCRHMDAEVRLKAATALMPYRYAKLEMRDHSLLNYLSGKAEDKENA